MEIDAFLPAMDPITHAAVGAAVGELMLGKKLGNRALLWGMLFATLPDIDLLPLPFLDTARSLGFRHGAGHSLIFLAIVAISAAIRLAKQWKKQKISRELAAAFVFAAMASHVLFDCFTASGAGLLWPFTDRRVAFGNLFPIDPLVTLPLAAAMIRLAFLRAKKQLPQRRRVCLWGIGLCSGYLLLSLLAKWTVASGFEADLQRRHLSFSRRIEAPTAYNILLWRSVADCGDEFRVGYRSVFEFPSTPIRWTIYPKGTAAFLPYASLRETKSIAAFTDDWLITRSHAKGIWLADIRDGETRTWGEKKGFTDHRLTIAWVLTPEDPGDKLRKIFPDETGSGEMMERMIRRICGNREIWEGPPRLAGIHGRLPETLAVEE